MLLVKVAKQRTLHKSSNTKYPLHFVFSALLTWKALFQLKKPMLLFLWVFLWND